MTTYKVTGGTKLKGKVQLRGAKNAGFKAMIAALLADSPSVISNLGLISEIDFAKNVITSLGGKVVQKDNPHTLEIDPTTLDKFDIPIEIGEKSRSSMMYVGPLIAKFGKAIIPTPGGDIAIGKRPIDRHIDGLKALGATVSENKGIYTIETPHGLIGSKFRFAKITHTGTETLVMAAVKAKGITILENCAQDPEIDNMIDFLNKMGAKVRRTEPSTIEIEGVSSLHGTDHRIIPDRIEVGTYACMALGTKGEVEILGVDASILTSLLGEISKIGAIWQATDEGIVFKYVKPFQSSSLETRPYPGFLTDWQPLWSTLMTQANGISIIHETVHNSRFGFVENLLKMGAKIDLFNPEISDPESTYSFNLEDSDSSNMHAAKVYGPTDLVAAEVEINEIRGGATAMLAGLMASGTTVIHDPKDQVARGYEDLVGKLTNLGAKIQVLYN